MNYKSNELIEEFYNQEEGFSSLPLEEFKLVCKAQFELVANEMQSGGLRNIRLKYFCSFIVYPGRVKFLKQNLEKQKENETISDSEYVRLKEMYNEYEKNQL